MQMAGEGAKCSEGKGGRERERGERENVGPGWEDFILARPGTLLVAPTYIGTWRIRSEACGYLFRTLSVLERSPD